MPDYDLIVKNARVVFPDSIKICDIGIADGVFENFGKNLRGSAKSEILASDKTVFPAIIDSHVHFNEPGRTDWEGIETGSAALSAGGGYAFFDMPLNSHPPVLSSADVEAKKTIAMRKSCLDFGIWGGLTPDSLDGMSAMANAGVIGFKAFMCETGIAEFNYANPKTLKKGMKIAKEINRIVAVHAENPENISPIKIDKTADLRTQIEAFLNSRPIQAENEAVRIALELAGETNCKLHIVHVSNAETAEIILKAKQSGLDVSFETCPHYLLLSSDFLLSASEETACFSKCTPPLRAKNDVAKMCNLLLQENANETFDTIGSDHSPTTKANKLKGGFLSAWGGINGCQHGFLLLLANFFDNEVALKNIANCCSKNVVQRFELAGGNNGAYTGGIEKGNEANFLILSNCDESEISNDDLFYKNKISPYVGQKLGLALEKNFLRGTEVGISEVKFLRPKF